MHRHALTNEQWKAIAPLCTGKKEDPGVTAQDNRRFIEAVLWIAKTGAPWRDLPSRLGNWHTQFTRFRRWAKAGRWQAIFEALAVEIDIEALMLDTTIVRAHQHAAGAKKGEPQALGRSRGGFSCKLHAIGDGSGYPLRFQLTSGEAGDCPQAESLLEDLSYYRLIADKAYDSDKLLAIIEKADAQAVIPPRRTRKVQRFYDVQAYRKRNLIERLFNKLKQFRRIATRYDKTALSFLGFVYFASTLIYLR